MSVSLRIAIITPVFPPYRAGMAAVAYNHARLLANRGQEVAVFTPDYGIPSPKGEGEGEGQEEPGYKIIHLKPALRYGNAAWLPGLGKRLRDFDAVILQYPFFGAMRAVLSAKNKYGFKLVLSYNMDLAGKRWKKIIFDWHKSRFFPKLIAAADLVLASSLDYAKHSSLGKFWRDDSAKFQVLSYGVDVSQYTPSPFPASSAGRQGEGRARPLTPERSDGGRGEGLSDGIKTLLFVGALDRAHYFKGLENLIRALAQIKSEWRLVIAGAGETLDYYRQLAEQAGLPDKVWFAGKVSDEELVRLYQKAYLTVLPSIDQSESFGIVLVESLACGTPVIASGLPGVRSVFAEGETGFAVQPDDIASLRRKLEYVLENPDKISAMRPTCRIQAEREYDWDKIGGQLLQLLAG